MGQAKGTLQNLNVHCSTRSCCVEGSEVCRKDAVAVQRTSPPKLPPPMPGAGSPHSVGPVASAGIASHSLDSETRLPVFSVPRDIDPFDEDAYGEGKTLDFFTSLLTAGVVIHLAVEGCGMLPITASLDLSFTMLRLAFNGVHKVLPLNLVRSVAVELFDAGQESEGDQIKKSWKPRTWCVCIVLSDCRVCTFVFGQEQAGLREAMFFAECFKVLVENARFESTKAELHARNTGTMALESPASTARTAGTEDNGMPYDFEGNNVVQLASALRRLRQEQHLAGVVAAPTP